MALYFQRALAPAASSGAVSRKSGMVSMARKLTEHLASLREAVAATDGELAAMVGAVASAIAQSSRAVEGGLEVVEATCAAASKTPTASMFGFVFIVRIVVGSSTRLFTGLPFNGRKAEIFQRK